MFHHVHCPAVQHGEESQLGVGLGPFDAVRFVGGLDHGDVVQQALRGLGVGPGERQHAEHQLAPGTRRELDEARAQLGGS